MTHYGFWKVKGNRKTLERLGVGQHVQLELPCTGVDEVLKGRVKEKHATLFHPAREISALQPHTWAHMHVVFIQCADLGADLPPKARAETGLEPRRGGHEAHVFVAMGTVTPRGETVTLVKPLKGKLTALSSIT
ncbi:hypothetical protein KOW79_018910 [Hemibagrus wyckioides]|uniref:Uncharacterized protein n=1 Tax=Hemibagrus wyckioides TaxID=337641 RepID=A0A9D3N915_9TELE|nr:hypothetical protein KOW79_018910 [Hemibagrus wyckioides]